MIIASACLLGLNTNYRGENSCHKSMIQLLSQRKVIPVCPEQLGGCPTPRPPAEITGGTAEAVLDGKARVVRIDGEDVTKEFIQGAQEVLKICLEVKPGSVVFKENSPSCGVYSIYDGTHSGVQVPGCGVTTELLRREGFNVISEKDFLS